MWEWRGVKVAEIFSFSPAPLCNTPSLDIFGQKELVRRNSFTLINSIP